MFYTYILRSLSQPEQRYIGSTSDLKSCLAIRRFFLLAKNKRSETERAKDVLHSSQSDGGLYGTEQEKNMFYTYILRSISHPEQRYIGNIFENSFFYAIFTVCDIFFKRKTVKYGYSV